MLGGVEVSEASIVAFGTLGGTMFLAVLGWVIKQAVDLSRLMAGITERVADIEKRSEDHEDRLRAVEQPVR